MKKLLFFTLALALVSTACSDKTGGKMGQTDFRKMPPGAGPAPKIQLGKSETFTLENGLRVIVVENHKLPKVAWSLSFDNDPILEEGAAGYTGLLGELLRRGTTTRTKARFDEEVDFIGATLSTSSNGFFAESLKKHTDKLLGLAADALLNPAFPPDEFEKIKTETISGLASNKDDAGAIAGNVGQRLRYGAGHPYGEISTEETVGKATLDLCKRYYSQFFKPNVAWLTIVGDITRAEAEQLARNYFGSWKRGDVPQNRFAQPKAPEKTTVSFVNKPGAVQSVIHITYPIDLKPGAPDAIKASVANSLLGGFFNSYLMQNLREGHAYTYGARSSLSSDKLVGSFNANASVRNAVTDSSVIQFLHELNRIRNEKPTDKALAQVKSVVAGNFGRSLEDPATIARFALTTAKYSLPADYYATYLEKVAAVSASDIQEMAQKYIRPDQAHILVVGNKDDVADRLAQFSADGKIRFLDFYGNEVKEGPALPKGVSAESVLADYFAALGGEARLKAVKDVETVGSMALMGMDISMRTLKKAPGKLLIEMTAGGKLISKQVTDGEKGLQSGMGGSQPVEGDDLADLKKEGMPFVETRYKELGYKLMLKGIEEINGKKAYRIDVTSPAGKTATEFYDMETSLKIRESSTSGEGEEAQTIVSDFSDFREVGGIKMPFALTITGAAPMPMKVAVSSVKFDGGADDSLFMVK